jgi:hypothetical protein
MTWHRPKLDARWLCSGALVMAGALACSATGDGQKTLDSQSTEEGSPGSSSVSAVHLGNVGPTATALVLDPPVVTLTLDGASPSTASYKLTATVGGKMVGVTAQSIEFDRPDIASAANGATAVLTATGQVAGAGTLNVVYGGLSARALLVVNIVESDGRTTIPAPALGALNQADLPADPALSTMLYPCDETVLALGMSSPLMTWTAPSAAGDVYRLHLAESGYTYDFYQVVDAPGQLRVPQDTWDRITSSNTGDPLVLTLSRWDSASAVAYSSATESFTVAPEGSSGAMPETLEMSGQVALDE